MVFAFVQAESVMTFTNKFTDVVVHEHDMPLHDTTSHTDVGIDMWRKPFDNGEFSDGIDGLLSLKNVRKTPSPPRPTASTSKTTISVPQPVFPDPLAGAPVAPPLNILPVPPVAAVSQPLPLPPHPNDVFGDNYHIPIADKGNTFFAFFLLYNIFLGKKPRWYSFQEYETSHPSFACLALHPQTLKRKTLSVPSPSSALKALFGDIKNAQVYLVQSVSKDEKKIVQLVPTADKPQRGIPLSDLQEDFVVCEWPSDINYQSKFTKSRHPIVVGNHRSVATPRGI